MITEAKLLYLRIYCPNQKRNVNVQKISYDAVTVPEQYGGGDDVALVKGYIPKCKCGKDHKIIFYAKKGWRGM